VLGRGRGIVPWRFRSGIAPLERAERKGGTGMTTGDGRDSKPRRAGPGRSPGERTRRRRAALVPWLRLARALAAAGALAHQAGSAASARASSDVRGAATEFASPNGVAERCIALAHMPGAHYTAADSAKEAELCAVDFYDGAHALCPKVFSTSPGTLIYALAGGPHAGDAIGFEEEACSGGVHKRAATGEPISFKMSVNTRETSATFANSSLIYYHFARYFHATAHVPVAVFRSIDRREHARRVSARGVALSAGNAALKMNHAAWVALLAAEKDPAGYQPTAELFTPDGLLYGVLLHPLGRRYSEEMNGTRQSGWGDGQNRDFQETAPFRALRSERPLADAIAEGRRAALADPQLARATGSDATPEQMVFWMSDLVDITLLDFIFSQQDRIGNIDFVLDWYWVEGDRLRSRPATDRTPPADIAGYKPIPIKRTELGDNDAGVRTTYANYTKRTGMLEKLRHYRADVYRQLMRLDRDFETKGPLHEYVRTTFGLSDREFAQVVANTAAAATILRDSCKAGRLRFDLEPAEFLLTGAVRPQEVDCDAP
jgi:hypothetical protein